MNLLPVDRLHIKPAIYFVSAEPGRGKTHSSVQYIAANRHGKPFIYVAPTRELLDQTAATLKPHDIETVIISSDTDPDHVKFAIIKHLDQPIQSDHVLLITQSAYLDLPSYAKLDRWQVIIDEVPQVDRFHAPMVPWHLDAITDFCKADEATSNGKVARILALDANALERRINTVRDDFDKLMRPLYVDLISPNRDVFMQLESWNRIVENKRLGDTDDSNRLYFVSMLNKSPFVGSIMIGANLEHSLIYAWLTKRHCCQFKRHEAISQGLRPLPHYSGRVKLYYFLPTSASKYQYSSESKLGGCVIDRMDELASDQIHGRKCLYVANKDRKSTIFDNRSNVTRMPVVSHGLNKYDDVSNIYFSPALNREPVHFSMLDALGLDSELVHRATAHEVAYQGIMRTSLRRPESTEVVEVIVPDKPTAERLSELFGSNDINQIGDVGKQTFAPLTATQKKARFHKKKAIARLFASKMELTSTLKENSSNIGGDSKSNSERGNRTTCHVTFHRTVYDNSIDEHVVWETTIPKFIQLMKKFAAAIISDKSSRQLFNSTVFNPPDGSEGYRKIEYFQQSSFLILDFDNGSLSAEKFEDIFWNDAGVGKRRSFIICNSFSRCEEEPNRFRVMMFYRQPVTSIKQHHIVFDYVVAQLEAHGFTVESAKLDRGCRTGVQSFHIPGTNRDHPNHAFFRGFGCAKADLAKYALDVNFITSTSRTESSRITIPKSLASHMWEDATITTDLRKMTEGRHNEVYKVVRRFVSMGWSDCQIKAELLSILGAEHRMKKKVADAIKSARSGKYL